MTTQHTDKADRFVLLDSFSSLENAQIMRSRLETEGIRVLIPREPMASPAASDVSILVHASDFERAKETLKAVSRGDFTLNDECEIDSTALRKHPSVESTRLENGNAIDGSRMHHLTILKRAHLTMSLLSSFVLLSQPRWDMLAVSHHNYSWTISTITLAAVWPYVASWFSCRTSIAGYVRTWIFILFLVLGTAVVDIAYIQTFDSFGWAGVAAITLGQAAALVIAASVILVPKSESGWS
jgi:hypothetical protein